MSVQQQTLFCDLHCLPRRIVAPVDSIPTVHTRLVNNMGENILKKFQILPDVEN